MHSTRTRLGRMTAAVAATTGSVALLLTGTASPATAVQETQAVVASADPADWTPHVLDGQVNAVARVGSRVVVGGTFTQVRQAASTGTVPRRYLFAFDARTGQIDPTFVPQVDRPVEALAAGPDGQSVHVGGSFSTINGVARLKLARLDAASGAVMTAFSANTDLVVQDLVVRQGWLYASGKFTKVKGLARSGVARLDPTTGAVDPGFDVPFTHPPRSTMGVPEIDVSADGSRLVAVGNFSRVAGAERTQVAVLDLRTAPVSVAAWQTDRYPVFNPSNVSFTWCSPTFPSYLRDVDFSPDGSYFVVVTTGSNRPGRLCDTAARWESAAGSGAQPSWVNWTGGDSLTAVAVTGAAVYVGGHQRWMNASYVPDDCGDCPGPGPGGVAREGIAALDPINGLPFSWNPGRTRGIGVSAFLGTADGMWVGSDTDVLGGEWHPKLGFFPLAGGAAVPPNVPYSLPGTLYNMSASTGQLLRRSYDLSSFGPAEVVTTGIDWRSVRGAFALNGRLYTARADGRLDVRSFDGNQLGPATELDLHGLEVAPDPKFLIPGTRTPVPSLTSQLENATGMFFHRGRLYYTVQNDPRLYYRYFTPESGIVGASIFVASTGDGVSWAKVRGMTLASGALLFATADGKLWRVPFTDRPAGAVTQIGGGRLDRTDWTSRAFFVFR